MQIQKFKFIIKEGFEIKTTILEKRGWVRKSSEVCEWCDRKIAHLSKKEKPIKCSQCNEKS